MFTKHHIFLMYCGLSPDSREYRCWNLPETETVAVYKNEGGVDGFFPAFLLLAVKSGQGGALVPGFGSPGNKEDWLAWLDDIFRPGCNLEALARVVAKHNLPPVDIWVALPYPDSGQSRFGRIWNRNLSFSRNRDRSLAVRWWIARFLARWDAETKDRGIAQHLVLRGFYWGRESMTPLDRLLLPELLSHIRSQACKSMWIPYYAATPLLSITDPGFDIVIIQPSYWQNPAAGWPRLTAAAARARKHRAGIEIEFDTAAMQAGSRAFHIALDYLNRGLPEFDGYGARGLLAYYTGYKTVVGLCRNNHPLYHYLYRFVKGRLKKVAYPGISY